MIEVKVQLADGRVEAATVILPPAAGLWDHGLIFTGAGIVERSYRSISLFDAMVNLRADLATQGALLLCVGARPDIRPSMDASTQGMAYIRSSGRAATDLVDIFAPASADQVVSIQEQAYAFQQPMDEPQIAEPEDELLSVQVLLSDGSAKDVTIRLPHPGDQVLLISGLDEGERRYEAADLFNAMADLRNDLAAQGALLLCAGARLDVFPSHMTRSMGGGRKSYIMELGKGTDGDRMVDIFAPAQPTRSPRSKNNGIFT